VGLVPVVQEEAGGLAPGAWRLRSSLLWFNTFRQYGSDEDLAQLVDEEGLLPTVSAAWSPAEGWELRARAEGWFLGGGFLDRGLQAFHHLLGVPNQGRELWPDNAYRVFVAGLIDDRAPGAGLTQASAALRWFGASWSLQSWVKPPVPAHPGWSWSDRWATGLLAGWGDRWPLGGGWQLRAGLSAGGSWTDPDRAFGEASPWAFQGGFYAGADLPIGPRLLAQGTWSSVPRQGQAYLSAGAGLLSTGLQWPLGPDWSVEAALTEEFLTWATQEVGFQVGLSYRSPGGR